MLRPLQTTGLDQKLDIVSTVDEALAVRREG